MAATLSRLRLASRMERLGTESAFEVLVRARALEAQGKDIIHLEIGEPDFATPANVVESGVSALREGWTHYGPSAGQPRLREAVAANVAGHLGISVDASEVVVTPGGKPIMFFAILALVDEGDEVLYPNPGFPIYESMIRFVGGKEVPYGLREEHDFDVNVDEILEKLSDRTRLIILNSPHNPTGGVMNRADVARLAQALADRDVFILSDEIYDRLIYEGEHASIAQFPNMKEKTIILNGFSKTYAMTGWRLGYGVMRADLAQQITLLMTNSNSCTASFTQVAGVEALCGPQDSVAAIREEFRRRRAVIVDGLNRIPGFHCAQPHGAFYAFPNIRQTGRSSRVLAEALLNDAGVACLWGNAFGAWGEGYLRFSFANSVENLHKALERIKNWVAKNKA